MRWLALWAGLCLWAGWPSPAAWASAAPPVITGRAALLMDANTGQVLFAQHATDRMYPASTTKVLTALVAAESGRLAEMATVSQRAYGVEGTSCYLQVGETHPLADLVQCLMVASGNDAAVAIAEHVAGSVGAFAEAMNARARQAGATASHFTNPHGLHDPDHYTTALDLARIARAAFANPVVRQAGAVTRFRLHGPEGVREFINRNVLLWETPGVVTGKIGFTEEAGHTIVVLAEREGRSLLAVLMGYQHQGWMFQHAEDLLNWGFAAFQPQPVVAAGTPLGHVPVSGGALPTVEAVAAGTVKALALGAGPGAAAPDTAPAGPGPGPAAAPAGPPAAGHAPALKVDVQLPDHVEAPVAAGDVLGSVRVWQGDALIGRTDLVAAAPVPRQPLQAKVAANPAAVWFTLGLGACLAAWRWRRFRVRRR